VAYPWYGKPPTHPADSPVTHPLPCQERELREALGVVEGDVLALWDAGNGLVGLSQPSSAAVTGKVRAVWGGGRGSFSPAACLHWA
jgi:hypothetical protein